MTPEQCGFPSIEQDPKGACAVIRRVNREIQLLEQQYPEQIKHDWISLKQPDINDVLQRISLWDEHDEVRARRDYEKIRSVWEIEGNKIRGFAYEDVRHVNIGGTHPTIDDVSKNERIVTSMKTLNIYDRTYQVNPRAIFVTCQDYVDDFFKPKFKGVERMMDKSDPYTLPKDKILANHLEIAVPFNLNLKQRQQLLEVQKYGLDKGVRVIIIQVP